MSITDRLNKIESRLGTGCPECRGESRPAVVALFPNRPAPSPMPCEKCGTIIHVVYRERNRLLRLNEGSQS